MGPYEHDCKYVRTWLNKNNQSLIFTKNIDTPPKGITDTLSKWYTYLKKKFFNEHLKKIKINEFTSHR